MGFKNVLKDFWYIKDILTVIFVPIILLPLLLDGGSPEAKCAYCVIIMAIFWITEALPIAVTSLLPVFLFPMVGLLTVKATAQQYINDTNMLFIGGLIVAAAIEHWNIHTRIALRILLLVGSNARWIMLGLMAPTWFLSMWISNTATTAMMIPIANAILMQLKDTEKKFKGVDNEAVELDDVNVSEKPPIENGNGVNGKDERDPNIHIETEKEQSKVNFDDIPDNVLEDDDDPAFRRLCKCLTLSIAYAANVGGIGSLTGTGPNLVMKGQLDIVYEGYGIKQSPITFASWMGFGVPLSFCLVIIVWIWLQFYFLRCNGCCEGKNDDRSIRVKAVIRTEYEKLGPVSFAQGAVMGHFIVLALLWITRDMGGEYGWGSLFQQGYVKDGVPAIFIATMLFIFPSSLPRIFCLRPEGTRAPLKPLLSWKAAVEKVPWGVVFLLGGGFAMAYASQESGLSAWVGEKLSVLDYLSPWVLNLTLCYIVAAMTEVTSNTATCTLMMPILANLAVHLHQSPIYLMFPTAIATSFAFMLPVATPPNAVVFSYGYVRVIDMVMAGFILNIVCVLALIGFSESLGDRIFDFHTIPEEILKTYNESLT
ncbi:Na(+)/citrate cotransporter-like isoform X3 [Ruditapes philippinarum]|uniref:Na(+)/citrate cotransporter-like isoform X3 n=1 Tax=Ruditapes philippinarum TaxID=129788 RepID=UPI00295BB26C|nr:Na(+)/citrate cotransporter-like isoform X3 [Ruditapes philippinarum]